MADNNIIKGFITQFEVSISCVSITINDKVYNFPKEKLKNDLFEFFYKNAVIGNQIVIDCEHYKGFDKQDYYKLNNIIVDNIVEKL